ncbi:Proteasome subunit alpha type-3 [Intoshia linei]|uniref:Proteasome subunit alpha type-3 n=1 Tax=Intoshia linei TaxID=1819745 RepID=A0A177ASE9_9BILA|nr:Proteasome subunit alpha type-3 [Intoshia linei]
MSSIGAGYDLSVAEYSPDGQIFQIEYAQKAVTDSSTVLAICNKKSVVFASTKPIRSKLHIATSNKLVHPIDRHVAILICGLLPDGAYLIEHARKEAKNYRDEYNDDIPIHYLQERLALLMHAYTRYSAVRPFGVNLIIGGYDKFNGVQLYMVNTGGVSYGYYGCAGGKARQTARTEMEKLDLEKLNDSQMINSATEIQIKPTTFWEKWSYSATAPCCFSPFL